MSKYVLIILFAERTELQWRPLNHDADDAQPEDGDGAGDEDEVVGSKSEHQPVEGASTWLKERTENPTWFKWGSLISDKLPPG